MESLELRDLSPPRPLVVDQSALSSTNTLAVAAKSPLDNDGLETDSVKYGSSLGQVDSGFQAWALVYLFVYVRRVLQLIFVSFIHRLLLHSLSTF